MVRIYKSSFFDAYLVDGFPKKHHWLVSRNGKIRIIENRALKRHDEKFPSPTCLLYNLRKQVKVSYYIPHDRERLIEIATTIANENLCKNPSKAFLLFSAVYNFCSGYSLKSTHSIYREILTYKIPIAPAEEIPKPPAVLVSKPLQKPIVLKSDPVQDRVKIKLAAVPTPAATPAKIPIAILPKAPVECKNSFNLHDKEIPIQSIDFLFSQLNTQQLTSYFFTCFEKEEKPSEWVFLNLIRGIHGTEIKNNKHLILTIRLMQILNRKKWLGDYLKLLTKYHTSFKDELPKAMIKFIQLYIVGALCHPDLKMTYFYLDSLAESQIPYTVAVLKGVKGYIKPLKRSNISKALKYKLHIWGKQSPKKWIQLLS